MSAIPRATIKVIALDDHPLLIEGVVAVFSRESHLDAVWLGLSTNLRDFTSLVASLDPDDMPDIALVDLNLPDGSSTNAVALLAARRVPCVLVTAEAHPVPLRTAVQAGAQAVYLKHEPVEHFMEVVTRVLAGENLVTSDVAAALLTDESLVVELTQRELDIMRLIADGLPRKLVGKHLRGGIAESTVTTHLQNVVSKYRVRGRANGNTIELLRELRRDGHIAPD